ncbi:DUF6284 family protein [Streptomyces europaeiscabiei]|uniref:DUF6284 family protein n=1 Tax=Streptomyces europaeiscabiei TaxID=146819 RepID=A0ABU4NQZ0_9ACTN|nr:DUF6284 family protein [Streptomyces europaeiscabiei]MDX3548801.1 DUF6284 family protein [Streptomyces europaeiscabiei]MDX3555145.1 DUF6284 family protein [Streptomyces europaeiscabiei]MDX3705159.1 DUF6284 family protein [Streptomyces europaeiscabiei]
MEHIVTVQDAVTAFAPFMEPTDAELDAIEVEAPLIDAELELLDVQISLLDQPVTALDGRRLRRARRKVLAVRRDLTNQAVAGTAVAA